MYAIGDKIVYPLYGAGVIEDIEVKDMDGQAHTYYALLIAVGNLRIKISAAKADALGVRYVYPAEKMMDIMHNARNATASTAENWSQRYKDNMERIKSGNLNEVAAVYSALLMRERERGLSTAEKKMMTTAKQIILSEVILSHDVERTEGEAILTAAFQ